MSHHLSLARRQQILKQFGESCFYCGLRLHLNKEVWETPDSKAHNSFCAFDHLHASAAGGTNRAENLVPSCRGCNSSKGKKSLEEFRAYLEQSQPHRMAANQLRSSLRIANCPQASTILEAISWHEKQIRPCIFPGEVFLNTRGMQ